MHFGILYPNNVTASTFGSWVLTKGHSLSVYNPGGDFSSVRNQSILLDLQIQAEEDARLKNENTVKFAFLRRPALSDCDYLVVPNLDILPMNPDEHYVTMCMNTFRYINKYN